jgi:RNA 2',3'-cyclic 3'-phosphodiesterase
MRLFVAIDLPEMVKDHLDSLQSCLPTARWVRRQQMHLTLFFLGETERIQGIKDALASIEAPAFALTLAGVGRFPKRQKQPPRVLWVGIDDEPALAQLHQKITTALAEIGVKPEDRPFSPHITLARFNTREPLPEVDVFLNSHSAFQVPSIAIHEFVLFSSVLSPQGPRYEREAIFALTATRCQTG